MRLLLIRHGQIPSNVRGVLDTAPPGPALTDLGREQARRLPTAEGEERIGSLWISTALRTRQTAEPLAATLGLDPRERDGIREISAGRYEMSGAMDDVRGYVGTVARWAQGDLDVRMPGGEDGVEFFARYDAVVEEAVADAAGRGHETVALVSHGAAIRCWTSHRAGNLPAEALPRLGLDNTGIVVLDWTATGWECLTWMGEPISGLGADAPAGPTGEPRRA